LILEKKKTSNINEKKELLNIFKEMWQKSNSPLHRIYASWEDLVNHVEVEEEKTEEKEEKKDDKKEKKSKKFRVHLISYPRDEEDKAYGVVFPAKTKSRRVASFYINKNLFEEARDKKLVAIWDKLEHASMYLNASSKKKMIVRVVKKLGKKKVVKMLELCNIHLGSKRVALKQRKVGDIINGLYKRL